MPLDKNSNQINEQARWALLNKYDSVTDKPMIALSFIWLVLIIIGFTIGLNKPLEITSNSIWIIFILNFLVEISIAPRKIEYIRKNWTIAIAILIPAFRILRIFQSIRLLELASLLTSIRHNMESVKNTLERRGFGYVVTLTIIVVFTGAAGMFHFENPAALKQAGFSSINGFESYGDALWWTAMVLTTMGSGYWPNTTEGRILCWFIAIYAFTVFGYITATIASHFIKIDSQSN